jgi:hypothetical protein
MTFFVLLVAVGLNIVQFDVFDSADECGRAAEDAVSFHAGDVDAICVDVKNHRLTQMVGRGPMR